MPHASACSFFEVSGKCRLLDCKTALGLRSSFFSKDCVTLPHASMGCAVRYQTY